jgi:hypothetical protein
VSKYESYYLIRRLNKIIESENPPALKAIGCFLELDAYERYFKLPDDLAQWKTDLAGRITDNYKLRCITILVREGGMPTRGDWRNALSVSSTPTAHTYPGNSRPSARISASSDSLERKVHVVITNRSE